MTLLITGGTGTVGRPTVEACRAAGLAPSILSRRPGPDHIVGDLRDPATLATALDGATTLLHLATNRRSDARATSLLAEAARAAGVQHLVYLSIGGVDAVPLSYYRSKLECERLIAASGVPFTVLRATQFHDFVAGAFAAQRRLPRVFTLDVPFQPIDTRAVAARLATLVATAPANGRVDDLGAPRCCRCGSSPSSGWSRAARRPRMHGAGSSSGAHRAGLPPPTARACTRPGSRGRASASPTGRRPPHPDTRLPPLDPRASTIQEMPASATADAPHRSRLRVLEGGDS